MAAWLSKSSLWHVLSALMDTRSMFLLCLSFAVARMPCKVYAFVTYWVHHILKKDIIQRPLGAARAARCIYPLSCGPEN